MFSVVLMAILAILSVTFLIKRTAGYEGAILPLWTISMVTIPLLLIIAFFAFTTRVEAKQVGVLTTFGKPADRTYHSGLAFHMPWQNMTQIDATTQTSEYHGETAIKVILSDKNTADISATIRWSVNQENANDVYADFRSNDPTESLRKAVVSTQFKAALNSVFNSYDATDNKSKSPEVLAAEVEKIMATKTDELVNIKSITISYIKPDGAVQKKIDALQTQRGATAQAEEKVRTATAEAEANKKLSASISNDPNVLVSKCLDLISDGAFKPPAGFSCWPGGNTGVVIPSSK